MTTQTDIELKVCMDCAMLIANGEYPEDNDEYQGIRPALHGYILALNCPEDGCTEFSWKPCEGCGSKYGGDRHPAVAFTR